MTDASARWRRVEELCQAALERDERDRSAFVTAACGDDQALRLEVETLLAHAQTADGFLVAPVGAVAADVMGEELSRAGPSGLAADLVGRRIGGYEIVSRLGAGGMGEVYRARDTQLGREVAIKVLPPAFVADRDRLARFEREARVLASLNHPHIGAIYGVENTDAAAGSGQAPRALVLELVEGETLADRIAKGSALRASSASAGQAGLPIGETLTIARQIVEALEAAHEKGIVHRDLKPANIKITAAGVVKVLDFGLAKGGGGGELSQSPTFTLSGTHEGVLLGTAAYMSPEQARGQAVDKRADIWAFGCVLFEMLTGRIAFPGSTASDHLAAILEREPNWAALPQPTPAGIHRLLHRCLEKDQNRRLHDIADARIDIDDVLNGASLISGETAVVDSRQRPVRLSWSIAALLALVAVGALTWNIRTVPRALSAPPQISRLILGSSGAAALALNGARSLAITPDGTRIVYVGNNGTQLFVRPLARLEPTAIATGGAPLNWVFVSLDGQWVGFEEGATLKKVAITGGPVMTIVTPAGNTRGATWAPDGTIIIGTRDATTGLQRVSAAGGELTVLTHPNPARGERSYVWPEMLPGGRAVLFTIVATTGGLDADQVAVLDLETRAVTVVLRGGSHAHYVPTGIPNGHLVYTAGGTLRAVPFDLARLETRGTAIAVLPRLVTKTSGAGEFVMSTDGTLAYVDAPDATSAANTLVWVDRQGREETLGMPANVYFQPRVSPDGKRVAVAIEGRGNDIFLWDLARRKLSQVTTDPASEFPKFSPVWTRDGRGLLYFLSPAAGLFLQPIDRTGTAEKIGAGLPSGVTPDGTRVIFSPGGRDLMMMTLEGAHHVEPLVQTPFNERNGVVSPDGRWLAYESDSSDQFEIYVRPFPNVSAAQRLVSTAGGTRPLWAPGGRELFYVALDGVVMATSIDVRGGTWSAGSPMKVVEGPYATLSSLTSRTYDVSIDGKRLLLVKRPANLAAAPKIVVVQNWTEELKRLVPTR